MTIDPIRLDQFVAEEDSSPQWRVDELWPTGGRVLLAAQYKAGKTTLMGNLMRSLVDAQSFLDRFRVTPAERIVLIDDELDARTLRRWLNDQGIENTPAIEVISLRGRLTEFDVMTQAARKPWADVIAGADILILDCLRPMLDALGLSEAVGAGKFVLAFDALLKESGVSEGVLVHHMGHDAQRSRGDSRLRDWPDVEWRLTRAGTEPDAPRHFTAYGRDVDQPRMPLFFNEKQRRLTLRDPVQPAERAKPTADDVIRIFEDMEADVPRVLKPRIEPDERGPVRRFLFPYRSPHRTAER